VGKTKANPENFRERLRISRGNSYELNNQSLLSKTLYILAMKKKMFSSRATRAVIEKLDSMIKSIEIARK